MTKPLERADSLIRHYHWDMKCRGPPRRDFPTSAEFEPDQSNEVSLYHMKIWDEAQIRNHIGSSRKRRRPKEFKNPKEFGLAALSETRVAAVPRYSVVADPLEPNEFEPANPSHYVVKVPADLRMDAPATLYAFALGYSPPPILDGGEVIRCPRWEFMADVPIPAV